MKCRKCLEPIKLPPLKSQLTKREHFAGLIYQGMSTIPDNLEARKVSAQLAVECADALIAALNEEMK